MSRTLIISASPHIHSGSSTRRAMWTVTASLLPALACAVWAFGAGALAVTAISIAACMAAEWIITTRMLRRPSTLADGSAFLTGLLLAFNLPANLEPWIVVIGAVVAIGVGKMAFGGLGCNIFNPALVGRVFLLLSFPAQMTSWPVAGADRTAYLDAATGATPLEALEHGGETLMSLSDEFMGLTGGSLGEVSAAALLLGLIVLLVARVITWHIPVSILATVAVFSLCLGLDPAAQLLGGGLLLGAIFMATDYVTSPMTATGKIIYGVLIGVLTMVIRCWGAYPEGVSFAILLGNGLTPLIDRQVRPRRFGARRAERRSA